MIPGQGRFNILWLNEACVPQLSLHAATTEASALRACTLQHEKLSREAHAPQLESSPHSLQLEKPLRSNKTTAKPKIKLIN